jgi:ubiquinone/menaquinone biosynthesis C-methylase UbiE
MKKARLALVLAAALLAVAVTIWGTGARRRPTACPYAFRFSLDFPRPLLKRSTLRELLAPKPGERLLEIGPGTGYYSLDVARALAPDGRLAIFDIQQAMLDETLRRAQAAGLTTIDPTRGDARCLPYPDASFDGAFLVATLGEISDQEAALRELHRVLPPGGRLVVGEGQPDPHMVRLPDLQEQAVAAGFRFEHHVGGRFGYLARFTAVEDEAKLTKSALAN